MRAALLLLLAGLIMLSGGAASRAADAAKIALVLYSAALGAVTASGKTDRSLFVAERLREMRAPNISADEP